MTRVSFDRSLYQGPCVDEAVKTFSAHASFQLTEEPKAWVVQLDAKTPELERQIAGELGNYALGLTIRTRGSRTP
ncbi:MAG: hypothetical protein IPJ65_15255 [Archangiaceae bacterium]|nr:hypothetical protein [Archangiaceae bacterium]